MNESCTKEQSSTLSNDEFDNLLKKANIISIPADSNDKASSPAAADNHGAPITGGKEIRDRDVIVIPSLNSLGELPESVDNKQIFVAVSGESILYESKSTLIDIDTTHRHFYYIQNNDCLKVKSLHVSIVFSGVFDGDRKAHV